MTKDVLGADTAFLIEIDFSIKAKHVVVYAGAFGVLGTRKCRIWAE